MTEENSIITAAADAAAEQQQFFGDDIDRALTDAFLNSQTEVVEQVDNSEEAPVEETEGSEENETDAEETTQDETQTETVEDTSETADFSVLENKEPVEVKYPTAEELKAEFPRQSKDLIAKTAQFAEIAQKGSEVITKIGGEEFIEPMATIATGLKESKPNLLFQGIIEAGSQNALLDVVGNAVHLAINKAKGFQEDENTKEFGERLEQMTATIFAERFGQNVSLQEIEQLVKYQQIGWIEAIDRWKEKGFVDYDEFDEILQADKEPETFLKIKQQAQAETEKRLAAEAKLNEVEVSKQTQVEIEFDKENTENLEKVLDNVWRTSVLRDISGDSNELKEEKALFRSLLKSEALENFKSSASRQEILEAYKKGDKTSPKYKESLTDAVRNAILQTKENTAVYERIIAKLYGNTRNGQISKSVKTTSQPANLQPSQPPKQVEVKKTISVQDIDKKLEQAFAGLG